MGRRRRACWRSWCRAPAHLDEADELAGEILTRQPEAPLPLLVRAVAAAEHGEPALAADTYEQIATIARRRNEDEDVIIARLAAAEQWLRADKTDRAYRLTEQVLATMPAHAAGETARTLQMLGDRLVAKGQIAEADRIFESRLALADDGPTRDLLAIERARTRLLAPDGAPGRAGGAARDRARRREPRRAGAARRSRRAAGQPRRRGAGARRAGGARAARRRRDGRAPLRGARRPSCRRARAFRTPMQADTNAAAVAGGAGAAAAAAPPARASSASAEELERLLGTNPTDVAAAETLAEIYARIAEPRERAEALSNLLRRALGLTPERRKAIYASVGESAEASGDLDRAEQAYYRAATIEAEPAQRASFLVSHARVLLARGETETAISDLEEALAARARSRGRAGAAGRHRVPDAGLAARAPDLRVAGGVAPAPPRWSRARS